MFAAGMDGRASRTNGTNEVMGPRFEATKRLETGTSEDERNGYVKEYKYGVERWENFTVPA